MNKKLIIIFIFAVAVLASLGASSYYLLTSEAIKPANTKQVQPAKYEGKKILYVDSYHEGYAWSDGITRGVTTTLAGTGIELKIHRMDTKNNPAEDFKKQAGVKAKTVIEAFKPDVVILSDDNAVKYILAEFYRDSSLPFVYCGLNWDSSIYGLPYENATGMVEITLINQLLDKLKQYTPGRRIGYLSADTESERKNLENYNKLLKLDFAKSAFINNLADWKKEWKDMQKNVDILIFENSAGIADWDENDAGKFALENSKIPAGTFNDWVMPVVLIGYTKVPEEQGEYSAQTALQILDGVNPADISEATNKKGDLMLNLKMAKKLNVAFTPAMIKAAKNIIKEE
jgi:ABC-type uncharacterized transport system substrate-binding protein